MIRSGMRLLAIMVALIPVAAPLAFGEPVNLYMVERVAETHLLAENALSRKLSEEKGGGYFQERSVGGISELKGKDGKTIAYILDLEPKGYLVVPVDTDIPPVMAHSFDCDFSLDEDPCNHLLLLVTADMANRLAVLSITSKDLKQANNELWDRYLEGSESLVKGLITAPRYGPLVSTHWHQSSPYNYYCPTDTSTYQTCIVGCTATAMAQIVNYHQHPGSVYFSSSDNYTTATRGIYISASTANISSISYPASNDTAAKISYACGVSVQMDYTSSSSGAWSTTAAFTDKFDYCEASKISGTASNFYSTLSSDMASSQPALLSIWDSGSSRHSIVCDGYNTYSGLYHLNFGWGNIDDSDAWYSLPSGMNGYNVIEYGILGIDPDCWEPPPPTTGYRVLASGDYNGDEYDDFGIYRPSTGMWSIRGIGTYYFGGGSAIPVPGDYNGDGKTDIAVFKPSTGEWKVRGITRVYFGGSTSTPVPGDYNGDGRCDYAIFKGNGEWAIRGVTRVTFGRSGDKPVPADYNGDKKTEIAIFREGIGYWAIRGVGMSFFGKSGDIPVPMDMDGDGKVAIYIYRPSAGLWANPGARYYFGSLNDTPVPADYNQYYGDEIAIFRSGTWAVRTYTRLYLGTAGDIPVTR